MKTKVPNGILAFFHCDNCLKNLPVGKSPREWSQLEIGFTKCGLQIWCKRCESNVCVIDFQGCQHPSLMNIETSQKVIDTFKL